MRHRLLLVVFFILALLPDPAIASSEQPIEITVKKGDNLANICKLYLEEPDRWPEIARLNHLRNADLLYPGQKLILPASYLKGLPLDRLVTFIKGNAYVYYRSTEEWRKIELNDRITQGNRIRTGDGSTVEVTFGER